MSDAPNDPFSAWINSDIFKSLDRDHAHMATWVEARKSLLAELELLCGPVCPFDQKRASEHEQYFDEVCGGQQDGSPCLWLKETHDDGSVEDHEFVVVHPPAPEIEAWLRAHR
jgi:hypothetical protein